MHTQSCFLLVLTLALAAVAVTARGDEPVAYRPADGSELDVLVLDANGTGRSSPFRILDHEEGALGAMKRADERFVRNASSATLTLTEDELKVVIACPVPDGMSAKKGTRNAWDGDGVEFFVRPSEASTVYYQYAVNAAGVFAGLKCSSPGSEVPGWTSRATGSAKDVPGGFEATFAIPRDEVFAKLPAPGESFRVNFTRAGATCSGLSTWAAVGGQFSNIDAFGTVIVGGSRTYFDRLLAKAREESVRTFADAAEKAEAEQACDAAAAAVREHGDDPAAFAGLTALFRDLRQVFLRIRLKGVPLLVFRQADPWGGSPEPDAASRPLERILIRAARNSRAVYPFAVANLKDAPFLGQLKVFEGKVPAQFFLPGGTNVASRIAIRRGFPVWNSAKRPLYDPVAELAMKSVLRLAAREAAPLYLDLDTHGLAAGTYGATLAVKKAAPGYRDLRIPVEIEVKDIDLDEVKADRLGYDYVCHRFAKDARANPELMRLLASRGYNHVYVDGPKFYPTMGKDGKFVKPDLSSLGRMVEAGVEAGMPRDRIVVWIFMAANIDWYRPNYANGSHIPVAKPEWAEGIRSMVTWADAYLRETCGITRDRIIWYTVDEPSGDIDDPAFKSPISICHRTGLTIKELGDDFRTMTDPLPNFLGSKEIEKALPKLAKSHDIIELYRPGITPRTAKLVAAQPFREVWTYSIITKETPAAKYRRDYWENMRDGYREIATFWHMTDCAGGDAFDSTDSHRPGRYDDYASLYVDYGNDAGMLSRRQLAADVGFEDARLTLWWRQRAKGDAALRAKVDAIVRTAADEGSMAAMDAARGALLDLFK